MRTTAADCKTGRPSDQRVAHLGTREMGSRQAPMHTCTCGTGLGVCRTAALGPVLRSQSWQQEAGCAPPPADALHPVTHGNRSAPTEMAQHVPAYQVGRCDGFWARQLSAWACVSWRSSVKLVCHADQHRWSGQTRPGMPLICNTDCFGDGMSGTCAASSSGAALRHSCTPSATAAAALRC